jgi:hypothetical protein
VTYSDLNGNGGADDITGLAALGRYLKVSSHARRTRYANSLWELNLDLTSRVSMLLITRRATERPFKSGIE